MQVWGKPLVRLLAAIGVVLVAYLTIVFFGSIVQIAAGADRIHQGLGQPVFFILLLGFVAVLSSPFLMYLRLPAPLVPPKESEGPAYQAYLARVRRRLRANPYLKGMPLESDDDLEAAMEVLGKQTDARIRDSATTVFLSTALLQSGRLEGLVVLATQARLVWQVAEVYYQRPTVRQMIYLYSNVGASALAADYVQDIDFAALAEPLVAMTAPSLPGAVPGLGGISHVLTNSIAGGAANAFLTLRVGCVTKQYCESLSRPSRSLVRKNASLAGLAMVTQIVQAQGARLASVLWGAFAGAAGKVATGTVNGVKAAATAVADVAGRGASAVGDLASATLDEVKDASEVVGTYAARGAQRSYEATMSGAKSVAAGIAAGTKGSIHVVNEVVDAAGEKASALFKRTDDQVDKPA